MPVTDQAPAPYAPSSGMLDIINRYRNRGMQMPVTAEILGRAGVSDSLISRTLQALVTLDLITPEGMPTDTFEGIRMAPEAEYKQRLQEWLRSAYADVFSFVDPMEDDEIKIRDAFRTYKPMGQQSRMVSLYIGLCDAAGLRPELAQADRKPRPVPSKKSTSNKPTAKQKKQPGSAHVTAVGTALPAALDGLMRSLPPEGKGWTQAEHDKFIVTFSAVIDFCYPITEPDQSTDNGNQETDED